MAVLIYAFSTVLLLTTVVFAGLQDKPAQERGGVRGKVNLSTLVTFWIFICLWQFQKGAQGLAGRFCSLGMGHERPSFEVFGQEESKSILLPPVLFLGWNVIQSDRRQVGSARGPKEEANKKSDPDLHIFTHLPSFIKSMSFISYFKTH